MDEKIKLRVDTPTEESVDLAISYTPACSIYIALTKATTLLRQDLKDMDDYIQTLTVSGTLNRQELAVQVERINQDKEVCRICLENTTKFLKELSLAIKELAPDDEKPKPKIISPYK